MYTHRYTPTQTHTKICGTHTHRHRRAYITSKVVSCKPIREGGDGILHVLITGEAALWLWSMSHYVELCWCFSPPAPLLPGWDPKSGSVLSSRPPKGLSLSYQMPH